MTRIAWLSSGDPPNAFPRVATALREPNGLLAAGGDLTPERLLYAYTHGIFPWFEKGQPPLWWSPDPRCVLPPRQFHCSRRLAQYIKRSELLLSFNHDFAAVIRACRAGREQVPGTWITDEMEEAYSRLHELGWAHSVEIWDGNHLAGGLYGIAIGRVFFGESMFSNKPNASKIAMMALSRQLAQRDFELLDCQVVSPHLLSLGAREIDRQNFIDQLAVACNPAAKTADWPGERTAVIELASR
jgi:leucyl/phenylalanyl-tRNA--protein transferase